MHQLFRITSTESIRFGKTSKLVYFFRANGNIENCLAKVERE